MLQRVHGTPVNTEIYSPFNGTIDNRAYIGFSRSQKILHYIFNDLLIVIVLTANSLVIVRQASLRRRLHDAPTTGWWSKSPPLLFENVYRVHADTDVPGLAKFLSNFWFYKFGLETISVYLVVLIAARLDLISVFYSILLPFICMTRRWLVRRTWPPVVLAVAAMLPVQYLLVLGLPAGLCTDYPWSGYYLDPQVRQWLFLSDFQAPLNANLLLFDFFALLLFSRQWLAFSVEERLIREDSMIASTSPPTTTSSQTSNHPLANIDEVSGGLNDSVVDSSTHLNPVPDYFTSGRTMLDTLKSLFFSCFYWITLAVLFITANFRQNVFGLGYIIGCFIFLWNGNEFYLKPRLKILRYWSLLITYTCLVICVKIALALVGCEYAPDLFQQSCAVAKVLGIDCSAKLICKQTSPFVIIDQMDLTDARFTCFKTDTQNSSMTWDALCLLFLLMQKRIFSSHYFTYLVIEVSAQQRLASRGAKLIHEIQV